MSEKSGGGERKEVRQDTPEERVKKFVDRVAQYTGGATQDILLAARRNALVDGVELRAAVIEVGYPINNPDMGYVHQLAACLPGGLVESIEIDTPGDQRSFTYVFGDDGQFDSDYTEEQKKILVESFFLRYGIEELSEDPCLWSPEAPLT
jgi:hypothetical protein